MLLRKRFHGLSQRMPMCSAMCTVCTLELTCTKPSLEPGPEDDLKIIDSVGLFDSGKFIFEIRSGHRPAKTSTFEICIFLKDMTLPDMVNYYPIVVAPSLSQKWDQHGQCCYRSTLLQVCSQHCLPCSQAALIDNQLRLASYPNYLNLEYLPSWYQQSPENLPIKPGTPRGYYLSDQILLDRQIINQPV